MYGVSLGFSLIRGLPAPSVSVMMWYHTDSYIWEYMLLTDVKEKVCVGIRDVTFIWVNIGSGKGLLPDGTKPSPGPVLINCRWGLAALTWEQCHGKNSRFLDLTLKIVYLKITAASPRGQWVKSICSHNGKFQQGRQAPMSKYFKTC